MAIKSFMITLLCAAVLGFNGSLPSVDVKTFDGENVNIKEYTSNGKIQLVSLWATWCGPCKRELNALKKVYPEWKEKYDLEIIAVTLDNSRMLNRAIALAEKEAWPYTFFSDVKGVLAGELGVRGIPYSLLIDQNGEIITTSEGYYDGYEEAMEKQIKALVKS